MREQPNREGIAEPMGMTIIDPRNLKHPFQCALPVPHGRFWLRVSGPEEEPPLCIDLAEIFAPIIRQGTSDRRPSFRGIEKHRPVLKPLPLKAHRVLNAKSRMSK